MNNEQRIALGVCLVTAFMGPFMTSAVNLCITSMSNDFASGATTVTWVVNIYTLFTAVCALPFGHLADLHGRRRMIIIGCALFAVSSLGCALSPNVYFLIGARAVMAVSSTIFLAGNVALMLTYFPPEKKGQMLGLSVTSTYVGLSVGPVLGGIADSTIGWRWLFVFCTLISVAVLIVTAAKIKSDSHTSHASHNVLGNLLFVASLLLLMLGLSEWGAQSWAPVLFLAGTGLLILFVAHELHVENPVVQVRLFIKSRSYSLSNLAALLAYCATFAVSYIMAIYLESVQGFDASTAGLVMLSMPIVQALISPFAGRLSDRIPCGRVASFGMLAIICGLLVLSTCHIATDLWVIICGLALVGVGTGLFASPNNSAVISCVDSNHLSEANSTINTMRGVGQSLSIVMVSMILSFTVGNTVLSQINTVDLAYAVQMIFRVEIVVAALAAVASLARSGKS